MRRATCFLLLTACGAATGSVAPPPNGEQASSGEADAEAAPAELSEQSTADAAAGSDSTTGSGPVGSSAPSGETPVDSPPEPAEVETPVAVRPTTILAPARAGRISTRAVRRVIDAHRGEIASCYEEGLGRNPNLEGRAAVRFLVGPNGRVEDAEVFESNLGDLVVELCITTAMRTWEFPRPRPRGRSVLLTYPYDLSTR